MKSILQRFKTLLVVLLIIASAVLGIWLIGTIAALPNTNGEAGEIIMFSIIVLVPFSLIVYFALKEAKISNYKRDSAKVGLLKETAYNYIKKKHSV